ncbi:MAG: hypothetical protein ABI679_06020 [Gemmatimonadota bacterium]
MPASRQDILFLIARSAAGISLVTLLASCAEAPTGQHGFMADLQVQPILPFGFAFSGSALAIDTLRLIVVRPPSTTLADTSVSFPADANSVQIRKSVLLDHESEDMDVTLEFRGGGQVLFTGSQIVTLTAGSGATTPPAIPISYVGPGATLASLALAPRDSTMSAGDSLPFRLTGIDGQQQPVTAFYVSWSSTGTGSAINADGSLKPGPARGTFYVRARAPNGVIDSTSVTVLNQIFDATADFSSTANPNGPWSAGWTPTLGGAFTVYPSAQVIATFDAWTDPAILTNGSPTFSKNNTTSTNISLAPGAIALHPSCNANEFSVLRWTAPAAGTFLVNAQFDSGDRGNTDASVLKNGNGATPLFTISSTANNPTFTQSLVLSAGETLDFAIGTGGDGCLFDTTPISVVVSE